MFQIIRKIWEETVSYLFSKNAELERLRKEITRLRAQLVIAQEAAFRDALTGLYNRAAMDQLLAQLFAELPRAGAEDKRRHNVQHVAVLLLDLDHFKRLNDTYGHQFGDLVLREVAEVIRQSVRQEDYVFRYGGEEILVALRNADHSAAVQIAEKIRAVIAQLVIKQDSEAVPVTASIGVAVTDSVIAVDDVIKAADRALYQAKDAGRNRVVLYQPDV